MKLRQGALDSILKRIEDDGFTIAMQKEIILSEDQAREFYKMHENEDFFPTLLHEMTSLRAEFAIDTAPINQLHGSSTTNDAEKELEFFFPVEHTLAVIKPSALAEHKDDILNEAKDAGFILSEMQETHISPEMAAQFYKSQEGQPYYQQLVDYMSHGPSMVMILTKENAVEEWRKLMGPTDPEKAKQTAPESLRARFAKDILSNAVHGSSTADHALQSIDFFFGDIDLESLKHKYVYLK
uniref:Uncharacterized protein n=1 Tax=Sphaerodactylus townsendi TaxID=933632 RepID=A0ACB8FTT9_9SAUR